MYTNERLQTRFTHYSQAPGSQIPPIVTFSGSKRDVHTEDRVFCQETGDAVKTDSFIRQGLSTPWKDISRPLTNTKPKKRPRQLGSLDRSTYRHIRLLNQTNRCLRRNIHISHQHQLDRLLLARDKHGGGHVFSHSVAQTHGVGN